MSERFVNGREVPLGKPVSIPVSIRGGPSVNDRVRELVLGHQLARELSEQGIESFEEADDFGVPEDQIDPTTPWEDSFDPQQPGAMSRELEIRAGMVNDRTPEQKARARSLIQQFLSWRESRRKGTGAAAATVPPAPAGGDVKA